MWGGDRVCGVGTECSRRLYPATRCCGVYNQSTTLYAAVLMRQARLYTLRFLCAKHDSIRCGAYAPKRHRYVAVFTHQCSTDMLGFYTKALLSGS